MRRREGAARRGPRRGDPRGCKPAEAALDDDDDDDDDDKGDEEDEEVRDQARRRNAWRRKEQTRKRWKEGSILAALGVEIAMIAAAWTGLGIPIVKLAVVGLVGSVAVVLGLGSLFDHFAVLNYTRHEAAGPPRDRRPASAKTWNVAILALGTRGDVEPCLALAAAAPGGARVVVCGPGVFAGLAERYGVAYAPCGVDRLEPTRAWAEAKSMRDFILHAAKPYSEKFETIAAAYWATCCSHQADLVVAGTFAVHFGVHIAEALACPFWALKFAPDSPSGRAPPFGAQLWTQWPWRLSLVTKARHWSRLLAALSATQAVNFGEKQNRFRTNNLGLPEMTLEILGRLGPRLNTIYAYSEALVPRPHDWPACHHVVGFLMPPGSSSLAISLPLSGPGEAAQAFAAAASSKPICVCFGSMHAATDAMLTKMCVDAALEIGRPCIVIVAPAPDAPSTAAAALGLEGYPPDKVLVLGQSIPHDEVFPACACVVHHGGAGTTARALLHGTPSLVIPVLQFYDQIGWAMALESLGAGLHLRAKDATLASIRDALSRLLDPGDIFEPETARIASRISCGQPASACAWDLLRNSAEPDKI